MNKKLTQTTIDIDKMRTSFSVKLLIALALFLFVNVIGGTLSSLKIDLTEDKLYSLSPVTKKIVSQMTHKISMNFYVSEELLKHAPNYIPYAERLKLLLEQMAQQNSNIDFNYVKVEAFSEAEDAALEAGIDAVPLNAEGTEIYFGVHLTSGTGEQQKSQSIAFLQLEREEFLEYDIVKLLTELSYDNYPNIGVISDADPLGYGFAARGEVTQGWAALKQIQNFYNIEQIFGAKDIFISQPDMLLIAHGADLDDPMLWAIEQYLMRGGRALIYADPVFESFANTAGPAAILNSTKGLNRIFSRWGINIPDDKVVIDPEFGLTVNMSSDGGVEPVIHSAWLNYETADNGGNIASNDLATSDINTLYIVSAGDIQVKEPGRVQIDPLITSSARAQLTDVANIQGSEPNLEDILTNFDPNTGKERMMAARIIGSFQTSFPLGRPEYDDPTEEEKTYAWPKSLPQSEKPFEVVLVSDVDMLQDRFWAQVSQLGGQDLILPFAGNGAMLENAVENLSGLPALGQLRSRGTRARPFLLLDDIRQYAERNYRVRANELSRKLQELQSHIDGLRNTPETDIEEEQANQAELQEKLAELLTTRQELRDVQRNLKSDLEFVNLLFAVLNIAIMPIIVVLTGMLIFRRNRRKIRRFV